MPFNWFKTVVPCRVETVIESRAESTINVFVLKSSVFCQFVRMGLTSVSTIRLYRRSVPVCGPHRRTDSGSQYSPWRFTHPSINRGRRALTSTNKPQGLVGYSLGRHREPLYYYILTLTLTISAILFPVVYSVTNRPTKSLLRSLFPLKYVSKMLVCMDLQFA